MINKFILLVILAIVFEKTGASFAQTTDTTVSRTTVTRSSGIIAPKRIAVPGERFTLSTGQLFVPDYFKPKKDGRFNLVVFFHGATWCSEQVFYPAKKNAVLVSITVPSYQAVFQDTTRFQQILDEVHLTLQTANIIPHPKLSKLALASFSGGYVAVREILNVPEYYEQVDAVILADSLYCAFTDTTRTVLVEEQMAPFLKFALDAASGRKSFWFTHLFPPEEKYRDNTTTKTAGYLIERVHAKRIYQHKTNTLGMILLYSSDKKGFHIRGYAGMTNQDHFNHFYNLAEYYKKLSF
ncbi:MAG: hypothetical protein N3A72_07740 [bacterium]|nr:hypothetical protein [bacterium]